jgi:hypothetical protein
MKTNHASYSASSKLFLGILLAVCLLATAAQANPLFTGTFKLTNEVHWGNAVLAPGAYSLAVDQRTLTIIVRDAQTGKIVARELARPDYNADNDASEMVVAIQGNQRTVSSVRLAGLGQVFQQAHPFAASRRAAEEARNTEAIAVEVAKK